MKKKGFLEKLGLVETNNELSLEGLELYEEVNAEYALGSIKEDLDLDLEDVVIAEDIYGQFGIEDEGKSIFKVDEYASILPKELSTDSKRLSVLGILQASGISTESLMEDAEERVQALITTETIFRDETVALIDDCTEQIANLEKHIDELKDKIDARKKSQEAQDEIISAERERIEKIIKFIEPTV